jgi:hypothetical protein
MAYLNFSKAGLVKLKYALQREIGSTSLCVKENEVKQNGPFTDLNDPEEFKTSSFCK